MTAFTSRGRHRCWSRSAATAGARSRAWRRASSSERTASRVGPSASATWARRPEVSRISKRSVGTMPPAERPGEPAAIIAAPAEVDFSGGEPVQSDTLNESRERRAMSHPPTLRIHTDGASRGNPGAAAYAYVITPDGAAPVEEAGCLGEMTNNQAEYTALVRALEHALELGPHHHLMVHSDSELLVKQMNGQYRVKNEELRGLYEEAQELRKRFTGGVTIRHVRRSQNSRADELCNEALDGKRSPSPRPAPTPAP